MLVKPQGASMDIVVYTLLGLSYVITFILGYATRNYISEHRRHYR